MMLVRPSNIFIARKLSQMRVTVRVSSGICLQSILIKFLVFVHVLIILSQLIILR